jgi:hypothetical protein
MLKTELISSLISQEEMKSTVSEEADRLEPNLNVRYISM